MGEQRPRASPTVQARERENKQTPFMGRLKRTRIGRRVRFARFPSFPIGRPSPLILTLASILVSIFLLAGGVFMQLETTPLAWAPSSGQVSVAYPSLYSQTTAESYVVGALYLFGITGLLLCYLSARYIYKPRYAQIALVGGVALVLICFYVSWDIMSAKLSGNTWP